MYDLFLHFCVQVWARVEIMEPSNNHDLTPLTTASARNESG